MIYLQRVEQKLQNPDDTLRREEPELSRVAQAVHTIILAATQLFRLHRKYSSTPKALIRHQ